ncbi:Major facilitator superfamily domain-containing protein 1 [Vanrija pseudolonga]|uniref:Lysosomal dipeptide transporter MFSD1 n=1 Tax=Vanrija pseudolonga TaxID=143232 RepID=A0AAF1BLD9_9TREE|nr:Major facilitator superfamily domain-containing protein 1 [Vanrija pseudolonga]
MSAPTPAVAPVTATPATEWEGATPTGSDDGRKVSASDDEKNAADLDPVVNENPAVLKGSGLAGDNESLDGAAVIPDVSDRSDIPWRLRIIAFLLIVFFNTGASYADNVLGPLKTRIRKELKITNAQFGAVASANALVNSILPIIGGIGMDYWGATYAAIISCIFICVGAVVSGISAHNNHYGLLVGGHIIMGFGSTIIGACQNKLYSHWFAGSTLAFVYGLDIAWNRVVSVITRTTAVPLSNIGGFWGWALWIPAMVCGFNMIMLMVYWWFERNVAPQYRPVLGKDARAKEGAFLKRRVKFNMLGQLPKFFWILCSTQLFQNAAVSVYTSNLSDIQVKTRGTKTLAAGYNSSIQPVVPIVLTPLAGLFFDRIGYRVVFISFTGMLYVIVFSLIGLTKVHPLVPIIISSFALSTNAVTFLASIPVLVGNDRLIGTAFGVWKSFQNCNTLILEVAAGAIQDRTKNQEYYNVIYFLIAIKSIETLLGPLYDYLDGKWLGHSLRRPEKVRVAIRKEAIEKGIEYEGWRISRWTRRAVLTQLSCMIIAGWTLYIVYSLGT